MTRSSANWSALPGGYDALHCERAIWPSDSLFGIPSLQLQTFDLPPDLRLLPYRSRLDRLDRDRDICHFYLDDYRFESTWTRLDIGARHVAGYFATLTPDFSLYPDWPLAAQLWNTYRSRWLGRYWQEGGLRVIPTVNWSDARAFLRIRRKYHWKPRPARAKLMGWFPSTTATPTRYDPTAQPLQRPCHPAQIPGRLPGHAARHRPLRGGSR
ncbi:MAG: DUF4417 domain-containing protein [Halochromatium sp.]